MANFSWWRSWHGAPTDLKWQVIAARSGVKTGIVSAIAWALFDYASQNNQRGSIEGFDVEMYSVYSGFSEEEINAVIETMGIKNVIENGRLVNWDKRQPKSEEKIEAVREWRAKKSDVTECYQPLSNVTESYTEKIREDTEKIRKDKELKDVVVVERPNIYSIYEREIGALTGAIAHYLDDALTTYPEDWIIEALQESARQNKRSWAYAAAILKRRQTEGTATVKSRANGSKTGKQVDTSLDDLIRSGK